MVFACVPLAACGGGDEEQIDPNKTQLYVGIFEGGWGREWIDLMKVKFEKQYPNVQVIVEGKKSEFNNETLAASILTGTNDMYFSTISPYSFVAQETDANKLLNITDVVADQTIAEVLSDAQNPSAFASETKTIEEKMDPYLSTYMKAASKNKDKYFSIPLYTSFYNIVYDVDLFEESGYFIAGKESDGSIIWTTGKSDDAAKWAGQDGLTGTYDDGLPITYTEFAQLCAKLAGDGIDPLIWGSDVGGYRSDFFTNVWASYVGADEYRLGFTQSGHSSEFDIDITTDNAYELQKSDGKKAAITMARDIVLNDWYSSEANRASYLEAQNEYVYSKYRATNGGKRIAMLIEGGWWENECKTTREDMAAQYGAEYADRRYGVMTIPRFTDTEGIKPQTSTERVLYTVTGNSCVFIRKNAKQPEIAKKFLAFTTTDEMLRLYTRVSGSTRMYDYELTEDDLSQMSYYKRNLWDYFSNEDTKIVQAFGYGKIALVNQSYFRNDWGWAATDSSRSYSEPITLFMNYKSATVEEYMNALYNTHSSGWAGIKSAAGL